MFFRFSRNRHFIRGNLHLLFGRAQLMPDMVFLICLDQVKEHFSEEDFDRPHDVELETIPGLRTSKIQKMAFWFGEGIGPEQIPEITNAFKEAIVNFTPNPYQREALRRVIANQEALEKAQMEHFPYCQEHKTKVRMAASAEIAAFAKGWNRGRQNLRLFIKVSRFLLHFRSGQAVPPVLVNL